MAFSGSRGLSWAWRVPVLPTLLVCALAAHLLGRVDLSSVAGYLSPAGAQVWDVSDAVPLSSSGGGETIEPSGADPIYPLNQSLDSHHEDFGLLAPNGDFSEGPHPVGEPPRNHDFSEAPILGPPVPNGDFETGDFTRWTTSGSPQLISSETRGWWARLPSSAAVTSEPLDVTEATPNLAYDVNYVSTTSYSWVRVWIFSGEDYATSTLAKEDNCYQCGYWARSYVDLTPWTGQSIKVRFFAYLSTAGVDNVTLEDTVPGYDVTGTFRRLGTDDPYAWIVSGGTITSAPFAVESGLDYVTLRTRGFGNSPQYEVYVLSGENFGTSTRVAFGYTPLAWETLRIRIPSYQGQQVRLRFKPTVGNAHIDDVGVQVVEVPEWTVTGDTQWLEDAESSGYVSTTASITSAPFTLPADIQQLTVLHRAASGDPKLNAVLLSGPDFSTQTVLADQWASGSSWRLDKLGIAGRFRGETVRLRISRSGIGGPLLLDDIGVGESLLPGWRLASDSPIVVGEDENGSFYAPARASGHVSHAFIASSWISPAMQSGRIRRYTVAYEIGDRSISMMRVYWYNDQGQSWQVIGDAADSPTGFRTKPVPIYEFMGERGYLVVEVGGGRVYSIGDNVARQHAAEPFSRKVGMGVDTTTGAFSFVDADVRAEGRLPLSFTRYYTDHSAERGTMGFRWTHTYDTRIEQDGSLAAVVFGSGREALFERLGDGSWRPADPRVYSTLVTQGDGSYVFTTKDQLRYLFTAAGRLTRVTDPNDDYLDLTYDATGQLTKVTARSGRELTLSYTNGRLSTVTDPAGAAFAYGYGSAGDLMTVTDPEGGVRSYRYERHRLVEVVNANGDVVLANSYDRFGRVVEQTDGAGHTIQLAHNTPGRGATQVTAPDGSVATYHFDRFGRTTHAVDPNGQVIRNIYDSKGNLVKVVDPAFNTWEFAYDSSGNITSITDPTANPNLFTYNPQHLPTTETDARGNVTTHNYDSRGNLTSTTDPLGRTTTHTYDSRGNLTSTTDPTGAVTTYAYNNRDERTSVTDPLGNTTGYTYDPAGRVTSVTDPAGATTQYIYDLVGSLIMIIHPGGGFTSYLYDAVGHLLRVEDPLGRRTSWSYDERGLVKTKTDPSGGVTSYTYDANRRMTTVTDPLGRTTSYAHDDAGRLLTVTDPSGATTTYAYDDAGRVGAQQDPLGRTTSYGYDDAGRLTAVTQPNGAVLSYDYDPDGNLTGITDALGHTTTHTYDAASQRTTTTDPLPSTTTYTYDGAGRLIEKTNPLGGTTQHTYDAAGRTIEYRDELDRSTTYAYDAAGRPTATTDALGRATSRAYDAVGRLATVTDASGGVTTYSYDVAGQLTRVTLPSGRERTYSYDPRGLLATSTDPAGNTTTNTYDAAGQLVAVTDPLGRTTSHAYDPAGRPVTLTDALGGTVTFTYDTAGQRTGVTDPRGSTWHAAYDALGNPTTLTDPLGRTTTIEYDALGRPKAVTDPRGITVSDSYDAGGRLTQRSYPGGSLTYAYDALGRRTSAADGSASTTWTYDAASQVTAVTSPQGQVGYGYDAAGQRITMSVPAGTVTYAYNPRGLLAELTDPAGRQTTFDYDIDGRRTAINRPNGATTALTYDAADNVTAISHQLPGSQTRTYGATFDAAGNRIAASGPAGSETYQLDDLNRLTSVTYADGTTTSYTYDPAGNWLTENRGATTTNYSYDAAGQLLSAGSRQFTYDPAGNLTADGDTTYEWDWASRLRQARQPDTTPPSAFNLFGLISQPDTTSYGYDPDGVRVTATHNGTTTNYLHDRIGRLPTIVADGDSTFLHTEGTPLAAISSGGQDQLLTDGLGSVRAVSSPSGALTATADYEVFGTPRPGSTATGLFGFTGEPTDQATGLVHLRARDLDPTTGRLLSADTVQPNAPGTQGYNRYSYVANNPTTWIDPTGHTAAAAGTAIGMMLAGILAALSLKVVVIGLALAAIFAIVALVLWCAIADNCMANVAADIRTIVTDGSTSLEGKRTWNETELRNADRSHPEIPKAGPIGAGDPLPTSQQARVCPAPNTTGRDCGLPVFMPGGDTPQTTAHIIDALRSNPSWSLLTRAQHPDSTTSRQWYRGDSRCSGVIGDELSCDEYPFFASRQGGPGASLRLVPGWEQDLQGGYLSAFYAVCGIAHGDDYLVVPMGAQPTTTFRC